MTTLLAGGAMSGCRKLYCPQQSTPGCVTVPLIRDYAQDERDEKAGLTKGAASNYKCLSCGKRFRADISEQGVVEFVND